MAGRGRETSFWKYVEIQTHYAIHQKEEEKLISRRRKKGCYNSLHNMAGKGREMNKIHACTCIGTETHFSGSRKINNSFGRGR